MSSRGAHDRPRDQVGEGELLAGGLELGAARRPARRPARVRKLVAVGIERLSSMNRASVAAGPRIGLGSPAGAGAAGRPACRRRRPRRHSTSSLVTRPRGPVPLSSRVSMPCSAAIRAATGVALASPLPDGAGVAASEPRRLSSAAGAGALARRAGARLDPAQHGAHRHGLVGLDQQLGDGAGHRRRQLGVDLVGGDLDQRSSSATLSPGLTSHSSIVPSTTESPISGSVTSTISPPPLGARLRRPPVGRRLRRRRGVARLDLAQRLAHRHGLVGLDEDLGEHARRRGRDLARRPCRWTSRPGRSPSATVSPTCFSHSSTVPSVTDSPTEGMTI